MAPGLELLQTKLQVLHRFHQKHWRRVQEFRQYPPAAANAGVACNLLFLHTDLTQVISSYLLIKQIISCGHVQSVSGVRESGELSGRNEQNCTRQSVTHTLTHTHTLTQLRDTWELLTARFKINSEALTARFAAIHGLCHFLRVNVNVTTCGHV